MLRRVEIHNRLNGYLIVIAEFGLVAAVAGSFGAYYLGHGRVIEGLIAFGVTANACVILFLCVRALRDGQTGVGVWRIYTDPATRRQVMLENPRLSADTLAIAASVLVPFLLVILCTWDGTHRRG
ncbi:MAG: hypothetical protein ACREN2_12380 [Candidatus Dormibacteria bacterium]